MPAKQRRKLLMNPHPGAAVHTARCASALLLRVLQVFRLLEVLP